MGGQSSKIEPKDTLGLCIPAGELQSVVEDMVTPVFCMMVVLETCLCCSRCKGLAFVFRPPLPAYFSGADPL
jgi:hypothetical protein